MNDGSASPGTGNRGASSSFELSEPTPGRLVLRGELSFRTATAANAALTRRLSAGRPDAALELSLEGVSRSDSAGLAVLLEALSVAKSHGSALRLSAVPKAIVDIARISEVDELLLRPLAR